MILAKFLGRDPFRRSWPGCRWEIEPTTTGCTFSFNDNLEFPYGLWGKVMGFFGERMARKSSQAILQNIKRLAEA